MAHVHEQDLVTVREIPKARLAAAGWLVLALVVAAVAAWEWKMRSLGLLAGDLEDGKSGWAVERRRLESGDNDGVVIIGGSRILFDTNLDAWQAMTGKRPVQLAMPGMNGLPVLADIAENSRFSGLVIMDVTPMQLFRPPGGGNPAFVGAVDDWRSEGPAKRASHRVGDFISRYVAFLDEQYSSTSLIDQLDLPNRGKIGGPYLTPWKLSERYDDRQYVLWREIETNERLRQHAIRVWLHTPRAPVGDELVGTVCAEIARHVATIRARGGDVAFVRPPSAGEYYALEQRNAPRARTWDRMLREAQAFGIHFEDYPDMQGFHLPELSHMTREDAMRYTHAYVSVLIRHYAWLEPK